MNDINELLSRGVANIIPDKVNLTKLLGSGGKLNVYLGIDPTATQIHLGHAVSLRKLQAFAELGHSVTFLIGDFTALIGDTSDKDSERPVLTKQQIKQNFQTYQNQAQKIVDFSKVKAVYNSEWLKKLSFEDIVKLTQHFSVGDFVGRELIRKRLKDHKRVGLHELLYPVMQGYDSYFLDTDIQIGGTDQTFNMQAGRTLQKDLRGKESYIVATEFLIGTDGRKMSKTWGNAIWLEDSPEDMYIKIMSVRDDLIVQYFMLATSVSVRDVKEIEKELKTGKNPMAIKKRLAHQIITELNGKNAAGKAAEYFEKTVQQQQMPSDIPIYQYHGEKSVNIVDLLTNTNFVTGRGEARRIIEQGGVEVDGKKITNHKSQITVRDGMIIQVGKRKFLKLVVSS